MSNNVKRRLGKLAVVAGLLVTTLPLSNLVDAEGSTSITLHKLAYTENATEVANTGAEMNITDFGAATRTWNKDKDGLVKFTAYKLDRSKLNVDKAPQLIADEVGAALAAGGELPYGATKVGQELEVDGNGQVKFDNLEDGTYVFLETTVSGVVTQKAKPMLVSLPVANKEGRKNLDALHLYPKNKINSVEVSFKKYIKKFGVEEALLQNAQSGFKLYKGEPGSGTLVENSYQDLTSGTITVTDLVVGKYYFVEESKIDASKPNFGPDNVVYDGDVVNAATNKLTFEYTTEGRVIFPEGSLLKEGSKVVNFTKPAVEKTVDREDVAFDEDINYTVKVDVPANINKYNKFEITDTPSEAIIVDRDSLKVEAFGKDGVKIKDLPFTVKDAGTGFTVVPTLDELKALPDGTSVKITYKGQLVKDKVTVGGVDINNRANIDYDNGVVTDGDVGGEAKVKTYEANLKKLDSGLFNSGVVKQALGGAKFVVAKATGTESSTITKYLKIDNGKYTWVEDKEQATELETGTDGMLNVKGLNNGHYFFVETKAPEGYNINTNPYTHFEINNANAKDATQIEVSNDRRADMPITGTEATVIVLAGLAGATIIVTVVKRRREGKQEA